MNLAEEAPKGVEKAEGHGNKFKQGEKLWVLI